MVQHSLYILVLFSIYGTVLPPHPLWYSYPYRIQYFLHIPDTVLPPWYNSSFTYLVPFFLHGFRFPVHRGTLVYTP
jgi:hypothetical protein